MSDRYSGALVIPSDAERRRVPPCTLGMALIGRAICRSLRSELGLSLPVTESEEVLAE